MRHNACISLRTGGKEGHNMNFDHLKNFITVAEELNLSVAAKKLYIAQPALSKQLRSLEEEYGCRLIERTTSSMTLTQAGKLLYERMKTIRDIESETRSELVSLAKDKTETLRVGLTPMNSLRVFGDSFSGFFRSHGDVRFNIVEGSSTDIISGLRSGSIDLAVVNGELYPYSDISVCFSREYGYSAAFLPEGGFFPADTERLTLKELASKPLCVSKRYENDIRGAVGSEVFMNIVFSLSYLDRGIQMVRNGLAVAILPAYAAEDFTRVGACVVPLEEEGLRISRYLLIHSDIKQSPAAVDFCEYCRGIL